MRNYHVLSGSHFQDNNSLFVTLPITHHHNVIMSHLSDYNIVCSMVLGRHPLRAVLQTGLASASQRSRYACGVSTPDGWYSSAPCYFQNILIIIRSPQRSVFQACSNCGAHVHNNYEGSMYRWLTSSFMFALWIVIFEYRCNHLLPRY